MQGLRVIVYFSGILLLSAAISVTTPYAEKRGRVKTPSVSQGKTVFMEYTFKLDDNTVIESTSGKKPFSFVPGERQIVPGLEKALLGMKLGESKHVDVSPEEGYGPVQKERLHEVSKDKIPPEALKAGGKLQGRTADGRSMDVIIKEIKDTTVILDYNHPLAGKTLYFDVKILDIQ